MTKRGKIINNPSEINCHNCNWKWKVKDGGDDLFICHKCYSDNSMFYTFSGVEGNKVSNTSLNLNNIPYKVGTIKLTWIDPDNYKILSGRMFNSIEEALQNIPKSKGNNWLLFKLISTDGNEYNWELLPYGKHKGYERGMKFRDNKLLYFGAISLMFLGAYFLIIKVNKKIN
jgi:hypothetical protein